MTTGGPGAQVELVPLAAGDAEPVWALVQATDVREHVLVDLPASLESIAELIAQSVDPSCTDRYWRIRLGEVACAGIVGLQTPSRASLALRAIGWRSLELVIAVHPANRRLGVATGAIEIIAGLAKADGMTFALVLAADETDERARRLMLGCGFGVLGHATDADRARVIYERAV